MSSEPGDASLNRIRDGLRADEPDRGSDGGLDRGLTRRPGSDASDHPVGRGWWKWGVALASLLLFAGLLWYAYQSGGAGPAGPVRTVEADPAPFKEKPEDAGGLQVPDQDKLVFKEAVGRADDGAEMLAPPPETPVARPEPVVTTVQMPEPEKEPEPQPEPEPAPLVQSAPQPPREPVSQPPEEPVSRTAQASATPPVLAAPPGGMPPAAASGSEPSGQRAGGTLSSPPGAGVIDASRASSETPDVPRPLSPNASGTFVQLGSFRELEAAKAEWRRVRGRYPDILVSPSAHVKRADIPGKGLYQRLMVGPYATRADAETVCNLLRSRGQACFIFVP